MHCRKRDRAIQNQRYVLENGDQGAPLGVSNRSGIVVGPKGFSEVLGGLTGILRGSRGSGGFQWVSGMILKSLKYP